MSREVLLSAFLRRIANCETQGKAMPGVSTALTLTKLKHQSSMQTRIANKQHDQHVSICLVMLSFGAHRLLRQHPSTAIQNLFAVSANDRLTLQI